MYTFDMKEIFKNVNLLYIIHDDFVLVRESIHQNNKVLDVFNFSIEKDIETSINNKLYGIFGKNFSSKYYGDIESVIKKEDVTVHINIKTYKVILDEKYQILDTYKDDVVKNESQISWLEKKEISNEKRIREGDRKILKRIFDKKNIDIKIVEEQGKEWINAKTIVYEDK